MVFKNQTKIIGASVILIAVVFTSAISWILYEHTVNLITNNLRERLEAIVRTGVVQLNPKDIEALKIEQDYNKPSWSKVIIAMRKIRENNEDIIFAYILRKSSTKPNTILFVADSHSINPYANTDGDPTNDVDVDHNGVIDATDKLQWPGQTYEDPPPEVWDAFNGVTTTRSLYQDEYGSFVTGYAPILDFSGHSIAVFAVDIRANEFFDITRQTLNPFLVFIGVLIVVIILLSFILISAWNKRVHLVEELDRQKDELLGIVSHQLATPVTSISWYLEMLLSGDVGKITEEQSEHLKSSYAITKTLSDLVSMILDVSRIQLGRVRIDKQKLDLNEFFNQILLVVEPKAKEKGLNFAVSMPPKLPVAMLDSRYTRMTIENLLTNAIKYTPAEGNVNFTLRLTDGILHCTVQDSGCGIPKAEQDKIFGKLFRASNVRNNVDGNGFGLYVAKGAVEAQGGKIWFESTEGKGTTFFVELPINGEEKK